MKGCIVCEVNEAPELVGLNTGWLWLAGFCHAHVKTERERLQMMQDRFCHGHKVAMTKAMAMVEGLRVWGNEE